jgi:hypothetical protein
MTRVAETGKGNRSFIGILNSRKKLRVNFQHTRKGNILRSIWEKSPWSASPSSTDLQAEASLGLLVSWIPRQLDTRKQQSLNFHPPTPPTPPLTLISFTKQSSEHNLLVHTLVLHSLKPLPSLLALTILLLSHDNRQNLNTIWLYYIHSPRLCQYVNFSRPTDYGLDGPGSNPGGDEIFRPSRPALRPTQPHVKWVPSLSRG